MLPLITKEGEPAWWLRRPEQLQQPHRSDAATLLLKTQLSASRLRCLSHLLLLLSLSDLLRGGGGVRCVIAQHKYKAASGKQAG